MIDFSTERIVAFCTFYITSLLSISSNKVLTILESFNMSEKLIIYLDTIIKAGINLIFAIILFIITHFLKKYLTIKDNDKTT